MALCSVPTSSALDTDYRKPSGNVTLRTQYAIANTAKGTIDRGPFGARAEAEAEMERLYFWKEDRRNAAEQNEASGFEGGNRDWYYWNRGDLVGGPPMVDYEWTIVMRQATPWVAA